MTLAAVAYGVILREEACKVGKPHCITEVFYVKKGAEGERTLNTKAQNVAGISESEEREEGVGKGQGRQAGICGSWRFLTLLPLEVVLERVTPLKETRLFPLALSSIHPSSVQCHIPDTVTTTMEAPPS